MHNSTSLSIYHKKTWDIIICKCDIVYIHRAQLLPVILCNVKSSFGCRRFELKQLGRLWTCSILVASLTCVDLFPPGINHWWSHTDHTNIIYHLHDRSNLMSSFVCELSRKIQFLLISLLTYTFVVREYILIKKMETVTS